MQLRQDMEEKVILAVKEFARSIDAGRSVVADISPVVEATSEIPLSNLDYWERLIRWAFSSTYEGGAQPRWKIWSKPIPFLTWLDLSHWDGHKREKTLRTLNGPTPNSFFFALALRRLNDWVPQVREAAREKLPIIAEISEPLVVVDAVCVSIAHWSSWGRIDQAERDVLLQIISDPVVSDVFAQKIMASTAGPMTSILAQVGRTNVIDSYLKDIALKATQPAVRAKAYRCLFEGKMVWLEGHKWVWTDKRYGEGRMKPVLSERPLTISEPFMEILKLGSIDRSSIVRRVAAEFLIRELQNIGEVAFELADLFARDKSSAVSERGNFALKRLKELDES